MFIDDEVGRLIDAGALRARRRGRPWGVDRRRPRSRRRSRLGEGAPRPVRAARRTRPRQLDRRERLGRGQARIGLRDAPPPPPGERRAHPPLRRLLRRLPGLHARLRRAARRVRARDDDRADAWRARRSAGGARPAGRRCDRQRRGPEWRSFPRRVSRRTAARAGRAADREPALPRGLLAHRPDRASLRDLDRHRRRPPDHALRRGQPGDGPVQRDARGRARAL